MFKKNRDFGRRPEMFSDDKNKDYASMMRTVTDKSVWNRTVEKHSEFKKPYRSYAVKYSEMEHFHPSGFEIPYLKRRGPEPPNPEPNRCDGAVIRAMVEKGNIYCGESTGLLMGGHDGNGTHHRRRGLYQSDDSLHDTREGGR